MAVLNFLLELGRGSEADAEVLISVLMAIPARSTLVAEQLRPVLLQQAVSKNYQLRQVACQLLTEANIALPVRVSTPLPTAYSLHFNVARPSLAAHLADPHINETFFSSPHDLVRPYGSVVEQLAEEAGLNSEALYYRTVAIMEQTADSGVMNGENEQESGKTLETTNIRYPFNRPRVAAAHRAIMHLVTELVDAGALTDSWAAQNLPVRDYLPDSFPEVGKPAFIHTLKHHKYGHVASDWVETVSSSELLQQPELSVYQSDWQVIGEYSLVRSLYWGTATETYLMHLTGRQPTKADHALFSFVFNQFAATYYTLDTVGLDSLVIQHHHLLQQTLKSQWLAFNPALAQRLGWQPAPDQLFGWQDQTGSLLVKSVYWMNGNISMSPPRLESEAGEGWLVLASAEALAQLYQLNKPLFIARQLNRSQWRQEEQKQRDRTIVAWSSYYPRHS